MKRGSPGYIENQLQKAAHAIQGYASKGGITCSSEKSELLIFTKHNKNQAQGQLNVGITDMLVAQMQNVNVLGLTIQGTGKANLTIGKLVNQCNRVIHMLATGSPTYTGVLGEEDALRIKETLIHSRILYHLLYQNSTMQN